MRVAVKMNVDMRFRELTSFVTARKNLLVCPQGSLLKDGMWIQSFSSSKKASSEGYLQDRWIGHQG